MQSISLIGLAALFSLPFIYPFHTAPLTSFYNEWLAGLAGLMALAILLHKPRLLCLELPRAALIPTGLIGLFLMQLLMGGMVYPGHGKIAILYLFLVALLMLVAQRLRGEVGIPQLSLIIAWATLMGGAINGLAAILQTWVPADWVLPMVSKMHGARAYGNLAQPNHLADHLALSLAALLYLVTRGKVLLLPAFILGLLLLMGMSLSGSRSAMVYLLLITILAFQLKRQQPTPENWRLFWSSCMAMAIFAMLQIASIQLQAVNATSRVASEAGAGTLYIRADLVKEAWQVFLSSPLLGVGFKGFSWQHFLSQAKDPTPTFSALEGIAFGNSHNLILNLAAELGIGVLVIVAVFIYWLAGNCRRIGGHDRWLILSMLAVMLFHSLVEYPLYYLYFLAPLAVLVPLIDDKPGIKVNWQLGVLFASTAIFVGVIALTLLLQANRAIDPFFSKGKVSDVTLSSDVRLFLGKAAVGGLLQSEVDLYLNNLSIRMDRAETWPMLLNVSERAMRYRAAAPHVYRHIQLLALNGDTDAAIHLLALARRAYPNHGAKFEEDLNKSVEMFPGHRGLGALRAAAEQDS
jgi:hypothetical protein